MFQPGKTCTWKTLWQDRRFRCKRVLHRRNTSGHQLPDQGSSRPAARPRRPWTGATGKGVAGPFPAGGYRAKSGALPGVPRPRARSGGGGRGRDAARSPARRAGRHLRHRAPGGSGGGAGSTPKGGPPPPPGDHRRRPRAHETVPQVRRPRTQQREHQRREGHRGSHAEPRNLMPGSTRRKGTQSPAPGAAYASGKVKGSGIPTSGAANTMLEGERDLHPRGHRGERVQDGPPPPGCAAAGVSRARPPRYVDRRSPERPRA